MHYTNKCPLLLGYCTELDDNWCTKMVIIAAFSHFGHRMIVGLGLIALPSLTFAVNNRISRPDEIVLNFSSEFDGAFRLGISLER